MTYWISGQEVELEQARLRAYAVLRRNGFSLTLTKALLSMPLEQITASSEEVRNLQELAMTDAAEALRQAQHAPPPELIVRGIYRLKSRNLDYGVWTGSWFIGIRNKLGSRYMDGEVLNYPPGTGTATPLEYCGMLPEGIEMRERDNPRLFAFLEDLEGNHGAAVS